MGHSSFKVTQDVYIDIMEEEMAKGYSDIRNLIISEESAARQK
jgi:integrase